MFHSLLKDFNLTVEQAYKKVYAEQLIGNIAEYAVQQGASKVVNDIRARGMRPQENGVTSGAISANVKSDVSKLTREDHREINKRAARGHDVRF
jgi:hypothetical protein